MFCAVSNPLKAGQLVAIRRYRCLAFPIPGKKEKFALVNFLMSGENPTFAPL